MKFILASGSASRRQILTAAAVPFTAIPADVDEDALKISLIGAQTPLDQIALKLAEAKALAVAPYHQDALVLGADQTLLFEGDLVSKCSNLDAARTLLQRLRGKSHVLSGGYALVHGKDVVWRHAVQSRLTMRNFSDGFLESYLAAEGESILACVGCYKLEGLGAQLFESVEGDYFSILGLSLQPLLAELRRQGVIAK
ncbi:MAG: Maf family protein [Proteobacteria bacterium]|nr:Maf family protein [Pseudomonadota bacterium]